MHHVYCDLRLNVDYLMTMRKCSIRCPTRFAGTLKFHKGVKFTPVCVRRDRVIIDLGVSVALLSSMLGDAISYPIFTMSVAID